jgi:hypothetical protein
MTGEWIDLQARAIRVACLRTTARQLEALHGSVEQGSRIPAALGWERRARHTRRSSTYWRIRPGIP